jgi:hypothetical protein
VECKVCYRELSDETGSTALPADWSECNGCGMAICSSCSRLPISTICAAGGCLFNLETQWPLTLPPELETISLEELDYVETIIAPSDDEWRSYDRRVSPDFAVGHHAVTQ